MKTYVRNGKTFGELLNTLSPKGYPNLTEYMDEMYDNREKKEFSKLIPEEVVELIAALSDAYELTPYDIAKGWQNLKDDYMEYKGKDSDSNGDKDSDKSDTDY